MSRHQGGARHDGGSMTLELAILTPAVLALLALVIVAGRIVVAGASVEQASAAAARAASQARSAEAAQQAAAQTARDELAGQGLHCVNLSVTVDTSGFATAVGTPAQVTARVACTVQLSDVSVPGMPGSRLLTAKTASVLDRFRSR